MRAEGYGPTGVLARGRYLVRKHSPGPLPPPQSLTWEATLRVAPLAWRVPTHDPSAIRALAVEVFRGIRVGLLHLTLPKQGDRTANERMLHLAKSLPWTIP